MTTLYLAGPITGRPEYNVPEFRSAERDLVMAGYDVLTPARHVVDPIMPWAHYMRFGIADVLAADGVAVLDEWWLSRGARLEVHVATSLDLPVRPVAEWERLADPWGDVHGRDA